MHSETYTVFRSMVCFEWTFSLREQSPHSVFIWTLMHNSTTVLWIIGEHLCVIYVSDRIVCVLFIHGLYCKNGIYQTYNELVRSSYSQSHWWRRSIGKHDSINTKALMAILKYSDRTLPCDAESNNPNAWTCWSFVLGSAACVWKDKGISVRALSFLVKS